MDQLLNAIQALLNPSDAVSQGRANEWLISYMKTNEAWGASLQLLQHWDVSVRFVAASALHTKVTNEWSLEPGAGGLDAAHKAQLMTQLLQSLRQCCEQQQAPQSDVSNLAKLRATASKLALALSGMAVRVKAIGVTQLLENLLPPANAPTPQSLSSPASSILLEVLTAVAEECKRIVGYSSQEGVGAQLRKLAERVLAVVAAFLREGLAALQQSQQATADQKSLLNKSLLQCLTVVHGWREFGFGLIDLLKAGVLESLAQLYAASLSSPTTPSTYSQQSLSILESLTEIFEANLGLCTHPRPLARDQPVDFLLQMLLQVGKPTYERLVNECLAIISTTSSSSASSPTASTSLPTRNAAMQNQLETLERVNNYIQRLSSAIGSNEMEMLAEDPDIEEFPTLGAAAAASSDPSKYNPLHSAYFEFHLQLTRHPYDREMVEQSLDVWSCLQDIPVASRKFPILKCDIFVALLEALLNHSMYPAGFRGWNQKLQTLAAAAPPNSPSSSSAASSSPHVTASTDYFVRNYLEDPDAFRRFRASLLESYLTCHPVLGNRYIQMLSQVLAQPNGEWNMKEAALAALLPITREIKDTFTDEGVDNALKTQAQQLLEGIMRAVWQLLPFDFAANPTTIPTAASTVSPILLCTGCAFIKTFSFIFQYTASQQISQELVENSVTFLLNCIPLTQAPQKPALSATASSSSSSQSIADRHQLSTIFSEASTAAPQDADNIAGLAFRSLCATKTPAQMLLINSPQILQRIMQFLFHIPAISPNISRDIKSLFLQGIAHLSIVIIYSEENFKALSAQQTKPMQMALGYFQEITSPSVNVVQQVSHALDKLKLQHGAGYQLTSVEYEQMRNALYEPLEILSNLFHQVAYATDPDMLQWKGEVLDLFQSIPPQMPLPSPSIAWNTFSSLWPIIQNLTLTVFLPPRDVPMLTFFVEVCNAAILVLYPRELVPTGLLQQILQFAMTIYKEMPLAVVLKLVNTIAATGTYGSDENLRETWFQVINQVYKFTMFNTKSSMKSFTDLYEVFFELCACLYQNCTNCFITTPSNSLTHILQFCVTILDSLSLHRGSLQKCLYFLTEFFGNLTPIKSLPDKKAELFVMVDQIVEEQGGAIVRQLITSLGEAMPPLLDGKIASLLHCIVERYTELSKSWIEKALLSDYFQVSVAHLTEAEKLRFFALAWPLRTQPYQWKAIWIQFSLICQGRETMESLLSFELVASPHDRHTRLRGSAEQDAAFASL